MTYVPNDLTDVANFPTVDPVRIYQDIIALDNLLSGGINQDNIDPDAQFARDNLATPYVTENISLVLPIQATVVAARHYATVHLSSSALYTILAGNVAWIGYGGTPATGNTFQVLYGTYVASGFASAGNIISAMDWYSTSASAGEASCSLATTSIQGPTSITLLVPAVNTPPSGGHLSVTLQTISYLV